MGLISTSLTGRAFLLNLDAAPFMNPPF